MSWTGWYWVQYLYALITRLRNNKIDTRVSDQWASLPVLFLILDNLREPTDHIRVAAVCKQWRVSAKEYNRISQRWQRELLPMLLVPTATGSKGKPELYNFPGGETSDMELSVPCNMISMCHGHGWLATMDVLEKQLTVRKSKFFWNQQLEQRKQELWTITLVNPFRKAAEPIRLPRLDFCYENSSVIQDLDLFRKCGLIPKHIPKVILSEDPTLNPDSYMVVAVCRRYSTLAFTKGGRKYWTQLFTPLGFMDAIFHKSQVLAVLDCGIILSVDDFNRWSVKTKYFNQEERFESIADEAYLVESTKGDLLHVRRLPKDDHGGSEKRFMVYKLVFNERGGSVQHVEMKSIGDEVMFLSENCSISVLASNFPQCQPNSIYYMDFRLRTEISNFNLEDETITRYPYSSDVSQALWIVDMFNGLC
ncbi:PREDICTED: F-box [Prunus dulcis]|uniref:PREDICTED: F-box n=1 Tax=Prunus dulcis TaxID=3755 RepID=A0A5E4FFY0_PRUDU|nr:uncharacterized protein LOC117614147 [Prunus dulcis]KAI5349813.1 hypothetical protein L3X38_002702 [Prunus dulcis]VVA25481.1 PREDICTED: F-box [Prunus dulcis]